ncbi:hypothetical protein HN371_30155 [Candidatus Poribacteria bacterium]|nr:hypothetical protein [Candidatus Poribacteria bacterium]
MTLADPPTVELEPVEGEQTSDIELTYSLSDADDDTMRIEAEFSLDSGAHWFAATLSGPTEDLTSGPGQTVIWEAESDIRANLQIAHLTTTMLRITPYDDLAGAPATIEGISVDYNEPPTVEISPVEESISGMAPITYILRDRENDTLSLRVEYWFNGSGWFEATVVGATTVGSGRYQGTILWDSRQDAPDTPSTSVAEIRVTVSDLDIGGQDSTGVFVIRNTPPPEVLSMRVTTGPSDDVHIDYQLFSESRALLSVVAHFSLDGNNWSPAVVEGDTDDITPNYVGSLVWRIVSEPQFLWTTSLRARLRLTPRDAIGDGTPRASEEFVVSNVPIPDRQLASVDAHSFGANAVAFDSTGLHFVSGGADGVVRVWDTSTRDLIQTFRGGSSNVRAVAFSPDGDLVAEGNDDDLVIIWRRRTGDRLHTLIDHTGDVHSLAFSPDGFLLASGGADTAANIWTVSTGTVHLTLRGPAAPISAVAFSPDGLRLAIASWDHSTWLREVATGANLGAWRPHNQQVMSLSFGQDYRFPDDRNAYLLASGGWDNTVRVQDINVGAQVRLLTGHADWVNSVSYGANGILIASASQDGRVNIWDVTHRNLMHTLQGHSGPVNSVAFWTSDLALATAGDDGTVRLWVSPSIDANVPPRIAVPASHVADEGTIIEFPIRIEDDPKDAIQVGMTGEPEGAFIDPAGPQFVLPASFDQAGDYSVEFTAADDKMGFARQTVSLRVQPRNPFTVVPAKTRSATEGDLVTVQALVGDGVPDGLLILDAQNVPPGATFDPATGILQWTPSFAQAGSYKPVLVAREAGAAIQSEEVVINVTNRSVFAFAPGTVRQTAEDALYEEDLLTADARGAVTVTIDDDPRGLAVDPNTGQLSFEPDFTQAGRLDLSVRAAQNGAEVGSTILVMVIDETDALTLDANVAPSAPNTYAIEEGVSLTVTVEVLAAVGPGVVLTMGDIAPPPTFEVEDGTGLFAFQPGFEQSGTHRFTVSAKQDGRPVGTRTFTVVVGDVSDEDIFVIDPKGPYQIAEGDTLPVSVSLSGSTGGLLRILPPDLGDLARFDDGILTLAPGFTHQGSHDIVLTATDGASFEASVTLTATVTNTDVLSLRPLPTDGEYTVREGALLPITARLMQAADIGGVDLRATILPERASFSPGATSRVLNFTPDYADAGVHEAVIEAYLNDTVVESETARIRVRGANPLSIDVPAAETIREGDSVEIRAVFPKPVSGHAPVTLTTDPLPPNATLSGRVLTFAPDFTQAGTLEFVLHANQRGRAVGSRSKTITITGRAPARIDPPNRQEIREGDIARVKAILTAPANAQADLITVGVRGLPAHARYSPDTDTVVFRTDYTDARDHSLEFVARQHGEEIWTRTARFRVHPVPLVTVDPVGPYGLPEGDKLEVKVALSPETPEEGITLRGENLPESNATFADDDLVFTFEPDFGQEGTYAPEIIVSQNGVQADRVTLNTVVSDTVVLALEPPGPIAIREHESASSAVVAHDLAVGKVSMEIRNEPANAMFDRETGAISFTPSFSQASAAPYTLAFDALQGTNVVGTVELEVLVEDVEVLSLEPVVTVAEGSDVLLTAELAPGARPHVTLATSALIDGMDWDPAGTLYFEPLFTQQGTHDLTITASEGATVVGRKTAQINVLDVEVLSFDPPGPYATDEGVQLRVLPVLVAGALHRVDVSLGAEENLSMDGRTGALVFDPDFTQAGDYEITVTARENGAFVEGHTLPVVVRDREVLTLDPLGPVVVAEGDSTLVKTTLTPAASARGVVLNLESPLTGAVLDADGLTYVPDFTQFGARHEATVVARQGGAVVDSKTVRFDVVDSAVFAMGGPRTITVPERESISPITVSLVAAATSDIEVIASGMPRGGPFDPAAWFLTFTPDNSQAGEHVVTFRAMQRGVEVDRWSVTVVVTDVNVPPVITLRPPESPASGDAVIEYIIADFDGDVVNLEAAYRLGNSGPWLDATTVGATEGITPADYVGALTWQSRVDVPSSGPVNAEFRIVPLDKGGPGDAGLPARFDLVSLLGDYTDDGVVDFEDFAEFVASWEARDVARDIGPAHGTPPGLTAALDGVLDFEDVAVFVVMWSWSAGEAAAAPRLVNRFPADASETILAQMRPREDDWTTQDLALSWYPDASGIAARVAVTYDPTHVSAKPTAPIQSASGRLVLTRHDPTQALVDIQFAWLGDGRPPSLDLGSLQITADAPVDTQLRLLFDVRHGATVRRWETKVATRFEPPPAASRLLSNYPNPFNPETWMPFELAEEASPVMEVYTVDGHVVRLIRLGRLPPGRYVGRGRAAYWDGTNAHGEATASGTYFYRFTAGTYQETRKLTVVR